MKNAPGWHPMVVHFPPALEVTAAMCLLAARLLRQQRYVGTLATVGTWNLCLGAVVQRPAVAVFVDLYRSVTGGERGADHDRISRRSERISIRDRGACAHANAVRP